MKTPRSGSVLARELEIGLEARELASVAVSAHDEVDRAEQRLVRTASVARASRIIPAHVPRIGRSKQRIASSRP